jgi:group II intron reverse transcriptase/maturase
MERVLAPANLRRAYQRVVSNKGAPGADGMTVADLAGYVKQYWPTLKARLLAGEYHPQAVRAVEIPKPQGGTRQLGIPSVVDRLIQQALQQQLTPIFDPLFSDYSYGFRPGRSAHQAIEMARSHVAAGHRWCVELDLEKFFDRVNHDILMACIERRSKTSACSGLSAATLKPGSCRAVSSATAGGRRKAARSRRCCRISCSTNSTASWSGGAIASCAMPMMRTSMCAVLGPANGCWPASSAS